jgi:cytochrome oxidase Cu insertion factor (SCO1/SenC/PrrC family)
MKESALPYWLTFAVFLAALYGGFKWYQVEQWRTQGSAVVANNLPPLTDFELTERSGKPFRSADMKGKVWVASFFFATCPGSCTRLNSNIKQLTTLEEISDVTWVSITVDPENDSLNVLREYADRFGADPQRWLFCRGEFGYVKRLADDVLKVGGVTYKGHNDYAVIVDQTGRVAGMFNATSTNESQKGVELMKRLLSKKPGDPTHAVANSLPAEAA